MLVSHVSSIFGTHGEILTIIWDAVLVFLLEVGITGDDSMSSMEFIGADLLETKGQLHILHASWFTGRAPTLWVLDQGCAGVLYHALHDTKTKSVNIGRVYDIGRYYAP